ncbi:hypothetical protein HYFRA_00012211 [Hymenoscyphus fraxineus]|uniref:DUF7918 domain-containing protein n=1 Tax=Hymenoscyphus fraxineus TaxID=746836 RepID=A0A9N9L442_9HELO|nr:hypothetical protein HYFRA_00012211 [Hymenoscyphus fraxineus]
MAILEGLPGIQVTIESDGRPLDEYPDDEDFKFQEFSAPEKAMSTVFVPCVSDAAFSIGLRTTQEYVPSLPPHGPYHNGLNFRVYVNGKRIRGKYTPSASPGNWSSTVSKGRRSLGNNTYLYQSLSFSTIQKIDDANADRIASDTKITNQGLGEIVVVVWRVICKDDELKVTRRRKAFKNVSQVSEKALKGKAISHGVKFDQGTTAHKPSGKSCDYVDGRHSAIAMFRFKYRSREALQQEMIIPRTPSPGPVLEAARPVSNAERLARLQREMDQIKAEEEKENRPRGLKREFEDDDDLQIIGAGKSRSRATGAKVEMIDLTDD